MKLRKITEEHYHEVKRSLHNKWRMTRFTKRNIEEVAERHGISYKTVVQIKASKTYAEYREQVKAQHGMVQNSLRDSILSFHNKLFNKSDNKYVPEPTARTALAQIEYHVLNNMK